jgi:hypothetical protein
METECASCEVRTGPSVLLQVAGISQLTVSRLSRQCGILNISQPYRPARPVTRLALPFRIYFLSIARKYGLFNKQLGKKYICEAGSYNPCSRITSCNAHTHELLAACRSVISHNIALRALRFVCHNSDVGTGGGSLSRTTFGRIRANLSCEHQSPLPASKSRTHFKYSMAILCYCPPTFM